jgi:hypothetical protein
MSHTQHGKALGAKPMRLLFCFEKTGVFRTPSHRRVEMRLAKEKTDRHRQRKGREVAVAIILAGVTYNWPLGLS